MAVLPAIAAVASIGASVATGVSALVGAFKKPKAAATATPTTPDTATASDTGTSGADLARAMLVSTSQQGILSSPTTGRNQLLGG